MGNSALEDFVLTLIKSNNGITVTQLVDKSREKFDNEFFSLRIASITINYILIHYAKNIESIMGYLYWREDNDRQ